MIAIIPEVRRRSNAFRLGQAFVVAAAVAFLVTVIVTADPERDVTAVRAGFELAPPGQPAGPRGVAYLDAAGGRVRGTVAIWGLEPRTEHYAALRGPGGRCTGRPAQVVAPLPRLTAGPDGVAFVRIDVPEPSTRFADGLAVMVHAGVEPASSPLACGVAPP